MMPKLAKIPSITDTETGEVIPIANATPMQISLFLTNITFARKKSEKVEKAIKDWVKKNVELKFDNEGHFMYGNHRISSYPSARFSEERLLEKGTEEEKKLWEELKRKFTVISQTIKF